MSKAKTTPTPAALKTNAAAQYIGISRRYLCDLAAEGRIPFSKIGKRVHLFRVRDLDSFLDAHRIGGQA